MSEVGSNLVIRGDGPDSITLVGVGLASFTAADIKLS
jgi:hypothetical protein